MIISTLHTITRPGNKIFENLYRNVYHDTATGIMVLQLLYPEEGMPEDEVNDMGGSVVSMVEQYRPKCLLADISNYFYHDTDISRSTRYTDVFFPRVYAAGCHKLAVIVPSSLLSFAYVDNILQGIQEEDYKHPVQVRYFDLDSDALRWLSKN
jgi:hypothetical protein